MSHLRQTALAFFLAAAILAPTPAGASGPPSGLDGRSWEMVSPAEKNGGSVGTPGSASAGALQAAAGGSVLTFGAAASFGEGAGAPPVSQYLSTRGEGGWLTANVSPPLLSGTYDYGAYLLFSEDLSRALLTNGWSCRGGEERCEAENTPLGEGAPAGYRNLYLREGSAYTPLITTANAPALTVSAEDFFLALQGASPDLRHVVFSTCAALTADATEIPAVEGCEGDNLYEWEEGQLRVINKLPGLPVSAPGASLAASSGAVSADGARVYWTREGDLYLRDGEATKPVCEGCAFQVASTDGALAFYTKEGHLYRYSATGEASTDLTPSGGVEGVLGASEDASRAYYLSSTGLYLWEEGGARKIADGADESDFPPATATARVTADGSRLAFLSKLPLTGYDNTDLFSGEPDTEVFLYDATANEGAGELTCASCHSVTATGRPVGSSTIPGARSFDGGPASYRPRALSADGTRLFFDSRDALLIEDSDNHHDVYEWEANGTGGCAKASGCIGLISDGVEDGGLFADASSSGEDAYFATATSIARADAGGIDIYDARAGGGFFEPEPPPPCEGDDCQGPAPGPEDATPGTATLEAATNPPAHFRHHRRHRHHKHRRHHRHHHRRTAG
ncbi:MAG TPA: hypothetical protein VF009_05080 [Solirubrobacterales bacterium]